jgi:hypothetical protein
MNSLEQSPRLPPHMTPPATPNVPSLALGQQHLLQQQNPLRFSYESLSGVGGGGAARQQPLAAFSLGGNGSGAGAAPASTAAVASSSPSASTSADAEQQRQLVWSSAHATLLSKIDACQRRMAQTDPTDEHDLAQLSALALTMRDLANTLQFFQ